MFIVQQTFVSVGESLLTMNQASYVTIKGLRMWYSRTTAVQVSEGTILYMYILYTGVLKAINAGYSFIMPECSLQLLKFKSWIATLAYMVPVL